VKDKYVGRRAMFSFCNFGSRYSKGGVASVIFSLKLPPFVILLDSSKLFMNLLTSLVADAVGLVCRFLHRPTFG